MPTTTVDGIKHSRFQVRVRNSAERVDAMIAEEDVLGRRKKAMISNDLAGSWEEVEKPLPEETIELPAIIDYDEFYNNIIDGDLTTMKAKMELGANIEREDNDGFTPLVLSIRSLQVEVTQLLLESGAEVDHLVPMVHAAGSSQHAPQMMKLLMDYGADPHVVSGNNAMNTLHFAIIFDNVDAVNFLVSVGMDMNSTCSEGRTPLTLAAERGHITIVKILLARGAELGKRCDNGGTALIWAANYGHVKTVECLLDEGMEINEADNAGLTALGVASNAGHLETVEFLIAKGANVNAPSLDPRIVSPVVAATRSGCAEVVRTLLKNGTDIQGDGILETAMAVGQFDTVKILLSHLGGPEYPQDSVALQIAMAESRTAVTSLMTSVSLMFPYVQQQHKEPESLTWIEWVLKAGGKLVAPKAASHMLHAALADKKLEDVRELLRVGADPNRFFSGRNRHSALAVSIYLRAVDLVRELLSAGADPSGKICDRGNDHQTALQEAVSVLQSDKKRDTSIVELLLASQRCKIIKGKNTHRTAFSLVLRHFDKWEDGSAKRLAYSMVETVPEPKEERSGDGSTLMHVAVDRDCREMVDYLLQKGVDINAKDGMGRTPFLRICYRPTNMLPFLVERGADPFAKDEHGQCGLHIAAMNGRIETMQYLLEVGVNIEEIGPGGYTPLITALTAKQQEAALWLMYHGASTSITTFQGSRTTLHHAAIRNMHSVVSKLLSINSSDINVREDHGQTPLSLACQNGSTDLLSTLLAHGADPEARDNAGDTPLHLALGTGNEEAALLLIRHGVDISALGMGACTPLHLATEFDNILATRRLLDRGANVEAQDESGSTPLSVCNQAYAAEILVKAGANVEHTDKKGWTPLHHAVASGSLGPFEVLLRAGADMRAKSADDGLNVWERIRRVGRKDGVMMQALLEVVQVIAEGKRWDDMRGQKQGE